MNPVNPFHFAAGYASQFGILCLISVKVLPLGLLVTFFSVVKNISYHSLTFFQVAKRKGFTVHMFNNNLSFGTNENKDAPGCVFIIAQNYPKT